MTKESVLGFLMGLGAGVTIGLLYTPKSGREVRRFIADTATDGAQRVKTTAKDTWSAASHSVERGRAEIIRQKEGISAALDAGANAYQRATI
jgi:gas vesicle protein